jgi:hypothetical protein
MKHYVISYVYFVWFAGHKLSLGLFEPKTYFQFMYHP